MRRPTITAATTTGTTSTGQPTAGRTWTSIVGDLPADRVARTLREDPRNPRVLYLGTEFGLFVSLDAGTHWIELKNNMPRVAINDLLVHPRDNDLVLGHPRARHLDSRFPVGDPGAHAGGRRCRRAPLLDSGGGDDPVFAAEGARGRHDLPRREPASGRDHRLLRRRGRVEGRGLRARPCREPHPGARAHDDPRHQPGHLEPASCLAAGAGRRRGRR